MKKFNDYQEAVDYVSSLPLTQLVEGYATLLLEQQEVASKITLTQEQFNSFFLIKNPNETRGRKKVILTDEDKAAQKERQLQYQREVYAKKKARKEQ